jgi:hypothetical protein
MSRRRYYVVAGRGEHEVELLKVEQTPLRTVIASPLVARMVGTASIHVTHHEPKHGHATGAIHISDARASRALLRVDPSADVIHLGMLMLDLSDLEWPPERPFAKTAYDEKWRMEIDREGVYVNAHLYYGRPEAITSAIRAYLESDSFAFFHPIRDGFGTAPGGHPVNYTQLVFDNAAVPTVGCLLATAEPPTPSEQEARPWTLGPLSWVAYGTGGVLAEGSTEARSDS